jgi:hypothetical protein
MIPEIIYIKILGYCLEIQIIKHNIVIFINNKD